MREFFIKHKRNISTIGWIILLCIIWEAAAYLLAEVWQDPMSENKLPYLHNVIVRFADNFPTLAHHAGITFKRALYGYIFGVLTGIILAVLMKLSRLVEMTAMPYLVMSQMIPVLGLAPIIFSLVKDMNMARTVIAAYITFFPVSVNMLNGLRSVDEQRTMMMYSFACSKRQLYTKLMLPASLPCLFIGLRLAAPMAVTASILVDTLSAQDGIGFVLVYSLAGGGTVGEFWPALLMSAFMGVFSYYAIALIEKIAVPWQESGEVQP